MTDVASNLSRHNKYSFLKEGDKLGCVPIPYRSAVAALEWERNWHEIKREGEHPGGKSERSPVLFTLSFNRIVISIVISNRYVSSISVHRLYGGSTTD